MNGLTNTGPMMSSRELADLVEKRHDNVKRTIEMLVERGVIASPQVEEKLDTGGRPGTEYRVGKRDSYVIVAQLSPEFTGRLVDRWWQLEEQAVKPALNPADLSRLQLIELAMQAEQERLQLEGRVQELEPKAKALDRIEGSDGALCLTDAAKSLKWPPRAFIRRLSTGGWIHRRPGGSEWIAFQAKIDAGVLEHRVHVAKREDGSERTCTQVLVTPKGIARLAERLGPPEAT